MKNKDISLNTIEKKRKNNEWGNEQSEYIYYERRTRWAAMAARDGGCSSVL